MATPTNVAYSGQVGIPLQAGKKYWQRFSGDALAIVGAQGGLSVVAPPIPFAGQAIATGLATGALVVSTPSVTLSGAVAGTGAAAGTLSSSAVSSLSWGTVPTIEATYGVPTVVSLKDYITPEVSTDHLVLSLNSGTLPPGWTLDEAGLRLIYDGIGEATEAVVSLQARDDALYWHYNENDKYVLSARQWFRESHTTTTFLQHQNLYGDWSDANGIPQGATAWASASVPVSAVEQLISFNVTALVQHWDTTPSEVCAIRLRSTVSNTRFRTKQYADPTKWPVLTVTYADATVVDHSPSADGYLTLDTSETVDMLDFMECGTLETAVIQFYRPTLLAKRIQSATLKLWNPSQTAAATVSAMQLRYIVNKGPHTVVTGIADAYLLDAGLQTHPAIVWHDGFELPTWRTDGSYHATPDAPGGVPPPGENQTCTRVPSDLPGSNWCLNSTIWETYGGRAFSKYIPSHPSELYARYYMKLDPNMQGSYDGGKFPGLSGIHSGDYDANVPENTAYKYEAWPNGTMEASRTGIRAAATGTDFAVQVASPLDGFAHQITIRNNSATDHSLKTLTVTGLTWDGAPLTRVIALPGPNAVLQDNGWFLTVQSMTVSASIGADTMDVGWALPELGGASANTGGGTGHNQTGPGTMGWSIRCGYISPPRQGGQTAFTPNTDSPAQRRILTCPLDAYMGDPTSAVYGIPIPWSYNNTDLPFLELNRWYCIEQHVKMNTPGEWDGIYEAWIDGTLVSQRTNLYLIGRTDGRSLCQHMNIHKFWASFQHGGVLQADNPITIYIDNFVLASQYIGPMRLA